MFAKIVFLILVICLKQINSQICSSDGKCTQEPFLRIPKISIILVVAILSFLIFFLSLCWLIQNLLNICRKLGLIKDKTYKPTHDFELNLEDKPPSYEEAILNC